MSQQTHHPHGVAWQLAGFTRAPRYSRAHLTHDSSTTLCGVSIDPILKPATLMGLKRCQRCEQRRSLDRARPADPWVCGICGDINRHMR